MWRKKRHSIITAIFRPIFLLFYLLKYNCKVKATKLPKEGAIILSNHATSLDPFLVGLKFNKPLYYMASMDLFQHKFVGKLIEWLVAPIPKEKSNKGDIKAIRNCVKIAKENGTICIFPEGNRTFSGKLGNVENSIVKMIKLLKKPLIITNIIGGYGSEPRWSKKSRRGKLEIKIKKFYQYEDIKDMDNEQLYKLIVNDLTVDDYNLNINYKGKHKAEYLERILYICPKCHKLHTIYTKGDYIYCSNCDLKVKYNENLLLTSNDESFIFSNISQWYDYQIDFIKVKEIKDNELIYQENIEVYEPILYDKKQLIGEGKMSLYNGYFLFSLKEKEIKLSFEDIFAITLLGKKKMNIYCVDKTYQVFYGKKTNLLKYMHMFYILKNKKEGVIDGFIGI